MHRHGRSTPSLFAQTVVMAVCSTGSNSFCVWQCIFKATGFWNDKAVEILFMVSVYIFEISGLIFSIWLVWVVVPSCQEIVKSLALFVPNAKIQCRPLSEPVKVSPLGR